MGVKIPFGAVILCLPLISASVYAAPLSPSDRDTIQQQQSDLLRREQLQRDELGGGE